MASLQWTTAARQDVDDIFDYVGRRQRRPATADKVVQELDQACREYAEAFAQGHIIGTVQTILGDDYRTFTHKAWVVIFRPIAAGIEVMRVVHGSRDYRRLFPG